MTNLFSLYIVDCMKYLTLEDQEPINHSFMTNFWKDNKDKTQAISPPFPQPEDGQSSMLCSHWVPLKPDWQEQLKPLTRSEQFPVAKNDKNLIKNKYEELITKKKCI